MTLVAANPNHVTNDLVRDIVYPTMVHSLAILGKPGLAPKLRRFDAASQPTGIRLHYVELILLTVSFLSTIYSHV
jgi:hypothetical protein